MMMTLLTLVVVLATAYVWCTRGFFSALIHLVCVLVAGAVAFGVWEPLGYVLLDASPARGTFAFLSGVAWALALALPFAITLAILRAIVDKILPANAQCSTAGDYIGGGICGAISGVISAGVLVLSLGFLRVEPDFWGYSPVAYSTEANGGVVRTKETFIPWVDRITAGLYGHLSLTTMRTSTPMARYHPDLDTMGGAMRLTYEGKGRNTLKADAFDFGGWYVVGDPQRPAPVTPLLQDSWSSTTHKAVDVAGEPVDRGYVAGYYIKWKSPAKEGSGQVVVGNGQLRLVVESLEDTDDTRSLHPVAIVARTAATHKVEYARFRFESDATFIASVGGESEANMALEFAIPEGYQPLALYVKGVRVDLTDEDGNLTKPQATWPAPMARDLAIKAGQMMGMADVGPVLDQDGRPVAPPDATQLTTQPIEVKASLGFTIQKGTERGLEVAEGSRRGWEVTNGEVKLDAQRVKGTQGLDSKLRIDRFATDPSTSIVQVDITPRNRSSEFGLALDAAEKVVPLTLIDTNGTRYEAVGYIFRDNRIYDIRYTRGQPLRGLTEAPQVSRSNPDRQLKLIFVVSNGVEIAEFAIGNKTIETYNPRIKVDATMR